MKTLPSLVRTIAAAFALCCSFAASATPYTIGVSATPATGGPAATGGVITYTVTITNGATPNTTSGNGFIRSFATSSTNGTLFQFNPGTPTGVAAQPAAGSAWSCSITPHVNGTNQFTCYAGDGIGGGADTFAASQTVVLKVDALVASTATDGDIVDQTSLFETDLDGNGVDEVFIASGTVSHTVVHYKTTDLGITLVTSNPTPIAGGAAFSYTLTVTNHGPGDAVDVVVIDPMPPGVIFQNVGVVNNMTTPGFGLICSGPPVATNGAVKCTGNLSAPIDTAKSTSTITIVAQIVENVASGVRTNTATVSQDREWSPNAQPNTASIQQNIQVNAPLSISVTGPATVVPGSNVVYLIAVNNGGSGTAINATITDVLPPNVSFVSMFGTGVFHDGCTVTPTNAITCASVDIPTGVTQLTVVAKTSLNTPPGPLSNTATIATAGTGTIAVGTSTTIATVGP